MFGVNAGIIASISSNPSTLFSSSGASLDGAKTSDYPAGDASSPQEIDSILNETFIQGSHTVKVRPPTRVKLNPNSTNFCFLSDQPLKIPILIKGIPPFHVSLTREAGSKKPLVQNITLEEIDAIITPNPTLPSSKSRTVLYFLQIPLITKPTALEILAIIDSNGDKAVFSGSPQIKIPACPAMKWVDGTESGKSVPFESDKVIDLCVENGYKTWVEVEGIMPITVLYAIQSGNNERIESINVQSEVESSSNSIKSEKKLIKISGKVENSNMVVYKLLRITDGNSNSIQYTTPLINSNLPPTQPTATHYNSSSNFVFAVKGHEPPTISFETECQKVKIRTGYDSTQGKAPSVQVPISIHGGSGGPFSFSYEFRPETDGVPPQSVTADDEESHRVVLTAYEPGTFVLKDVHDKFCRGSISRSHSTCQIHAVIPPTFEYSSSPIEEQCFGAVGAQVDLYFTGEAPYWLEYGVLRRGAGNGVWKKEFFGKHRGQLVLKPKDPGEYEYTFKKVGDANYNEGVEIKGPAKLEQIIHAHSAASFLPPFSFTRCIGETVPLSIKVAGSGPWVVKYEIISQRGARKFETKITKSFDFVVDGLDEGGKYSVELFEIKDTFNCTVKLATESISIEVLSSRPKIHFSSEKPIFILKDGIASLPISLSGRGPFKVGMVYADGREEVIQLSGSSRFISAKGEGVHKIISVSDSVCSGEIDGLAMVSVLSFDQPTMSLDPEIDDTSICVGQQGEFQLNFIGKAPFRVSYLRAYIPFSHSNEKENEVVIEISETIETSFLRIALDTTKGGHYTYTFSSVADDNYRSPIKLNTPISISRVVNLIPKAAFGEPENTIFHCTSKSISPYQLKVLLYGKPPFDVRIEQKRNSQLVDTIVGSEIGVKDLELVNGVYEWTPPLSKIDTMGKHEFNLVSVADGNGCEFNFDSSEPVVTSFEIADQARITSINPADVCIGDLLSYTLQGTPPFVIGYSWKGVVQPEITVADPMLSFWAGAAGELAINKICNSADCCDEGLASDPSLVTIVHSLPKAMVGQGDDSFDDIREGDESVFSVDFVGVPPFAFTYVRSRSTKEELFTVSDITDHHMGKKKGFKEQPMYGEEELKGQLETFGLALFEIEGDGNCLFRALSHQLFGNQGRYDDIRWEICTHIQENPEMYQIFVTEPFAKYVNRMIKDKQFGGNLEIVACSRVYKTAIRIYQLGQSPWIVDTEAVDSANSMLHIVYHAWEHYSSTTSCSASASASNTEHEPAVQTHVMEKIAMDSINSTSKSDLELVRKLLKKYRGNVSAVVDEMLNDKFQEESPQETPNLNPPPNPDTLQVLAEPSEKLSRKEKIRR